MVFAPQFLRWCLRFFVRSDGANSSCFWSAVMTGQWRNIIKRYGQVHKLFIRRWERIVAFLSAFLKLPFAFWQKKTVILINGDFSAAKCSLQLPALLTLKLRNTVVASNLMPKLRKIESERAEKSGSQKCPHLKWSWMCPLLHKYFVVRVSRTPNVHWPRKCSRITYVFPSQVSLIMRQRSFYDIALRLSILCVYFVFLIFQYIHWLIVWLKSFQLDKSRKQ